MKSTVLTENRLVEKLLYLTEIELRQSTEAMFFAYRGFTADPDKTVSYTHLMLPTNREV